MKYLKLFIISALLLIDINAFAQTKNTLIVKSHHPNDNNTVIKIWKTPKNDYIIRTSYSNETDDFDQEKLSQFQKKVEYDGFAKRVIFKSSNNSYYVIAHVNGEYALVFGFYSEILKDVISVDYIIDYIDKKVFNDL